MKKVTIRDLESYTGLSKSTISRVITNRGYVSDENRSCVQEAIQALGYRAKKARTPTHVRDLVLVVDELLRSPIHINMIEGINEELSKHGKKALIAYNRFDTADIEDYVLYAHERQFAGIIMLGVLETSSLIDTLERIGIPLVLLNQELPRISANIIGLDDYLGGYQSTKYLIEKGHTNIAFLTGYKEATAVKKRELGYRDALKEIGVEPDEGLLHYGDFTQKSGEVFAQQIVEKNMDVSAIISCNDMMSVGLLETLRRNSKRIPEDYSVISFDESPYLKLCYDGLTIVDYNFHEIGKTAAQLLVENINMPYMSKKKVIFMPAFHEGKSVRDITLRT